MDGRQLRGRFALLVFLLILVAAGFGLSLSFGRKAFLPVTPRKELRLEGESLSPREQIFWGFPVNLNEAGLEDLMLIKGIGRKRAEAIISLRRAKGGIEELDDLLELPEFGRRSVENLRELCETK
jgi:competence ComEA-like helix-hairpin-helix protein